MMAVMILYSPSEFENHFFWPDDIGRFWVDDEKRSAACMPAAKPPVWTSQQHPEIQELLVAGRTITIKCSGVQYFMYDHEPGYDTSKPMKLATGVTAEQIVAWSKSRCVTIIPDAVAHAVVAFNQHRTTSP